MVAPISWVGDLVIVFTNQLKFKFRLGIFRLFNSKALIQFSICLICYAIDKDVYLNYHFSVVQRVLLDAIKVLEM